MEYFSESLGIALNVLGQFERHVDLEAKMVLCVDHLGAFRDRDASASTARLVDCRLNGGRIVGCSVALGTLVLDIHNERRRWCAGTAFACTRRCGQSYGAQAEQPGAQHTPCIYFAL